MSFKESFIKFYKFNLIKVSLAVLFIGLTFMYISPLFSTVRIIPCDFVNGEMVVKSRCPINPAVEGGTVYFSIAFLELIYSIVYLLVMAVVIPYNLACLVFMLYYDYLKKLVKKLKD